MLANEYVQIGQVMWRAVFTERGHPSESYIEYERYLVVRVTPSGFWVEPDTKFFAHGYARHDRHWRGNRTYFCSRSREEACTQLKIRTHRYAEHCARRLRVAKRRLAVFDAAELPTLEPTKLRTYRRTFVE